MAARQAAKVAADLGATSIIQKIKSHADGNEMKRLLHSTCDYVAGNDDVKERGDILVGEDVALRGEERYAPTIRGRLVNTDLAQAVRHAYSRIDYTSWTKNVDPSSQSSAAFASPKWPAVLKAARSQGTTLQYGLAWATATATYPTSHLLHKLSPNATPAKLCPCGSIESVGHWLSCPRHAVFCRNQLSESARDLAKRALKEDESGNFKHAELYREMEQTAKEAWTKASARDRAKYWMGLPNCIQQALSSKVPLVSWKMWMKATCVRRLRVVEALHCAAKTWRPAVPGFNVLR